MSPERYPGQIAFGNQPFERSTSSFLLMGGKTASNLLFSDRRLALYPITHLPRKPPPRKWGRPNLHWGRAREGDTKPLAF